MCAGRALRAGLGKSRAVWSFQTSGEQQRHARNAWPARRVWPQNGVCRVAGLASIRFVVKRIFRFLMK
jgi:hypothetical protein